MRARRKTYLLISAGIVVLGVIAGLLVMRGQSFAWQQTKIFSTSQQKQLDKVKDNLTSSLAQNLAGQLLNNPKFLQDPEGWATLDKITADADPAEIFPVPEVSDADITVSQDTSEQAITQYINKNYQVFDARNQAMTKDFDQADIDMLQQAIENNDFKPLDKLIDLNNQMIEDLEAVPVPKTWQAIHKQQIGLFLLYGDIIKAVQNTESDPAKSLIALERFQQLPDLMDQMTTKISQVSGMDLQIPEPTTDTTTTGE